jgi:hypothetical protein
MDSRNSSPLAPSIAVSLDASNRDQWAWLDALARSFGCGILLVDPQATPGPLLGASPGVEALRTLAARSDSSLVGSLWSALNSDRAHAATVGALSLVCRRLHVQGKTVGALVIARQADGASPAEAGHHVPRFEMATIEPWLTAAAEAHLGQKVPDDREEAFDRIASLHRLLHDGVEGGDEREVVTAFAEALFAWDGIEAIGYVEDVQGQWRREMAPPGTALPVMLDAGLGQLLRGKQVARLSADDLAQLGFPADRHVVAAAISDATPEPWVLLFAEGYRPLNLPRLSLYADLLREALARLSSIVETRAAWAILQTLLGATDRIEPAVDAALREFSRVVDGLSVSLIVTNATGTTLLSAGDRDAIAVVRPFDRGNRLVSTAHLPDLGTMQLAVRRARGQSFTRREQHLVDRAATIFSAWLPGALKQPVEIPDATPATRGFEEVLDRAAAQTTRDGLDVSLVVIVVPDSDSRLATLQSWVTEIRARLRGTDLAGAISDREIGVLLSGTSHTDVPVVCARLGRSLGFEKNDTSIPIGSASRSAGSSEEDSIVSVARRSVNGRRHSSTKRGPL